MRVAKLLLYGVASIILVLCVVALVFAYWPVEWRIQNKGISPERAAAMRAAFDGPHEMFTASDGETIFLRRWNPDTVVEAKRDIAILVFHGFTAYSGPYKMAGEPFAAAGYTTFGIDYRGHGLSGGNRGDSPSAEQWIADLAEAVREVKRLGFSRVVVLGHSLGVAAAICAANAVPDEISALVLLSGAYESRPGISKPPSVFQQVRVVSSAIFRPSFRAVEYYRDGMIVTEDSLFNFRYTPRFVLMMDVKKLRVPEALKAPVLVAVGDQDELFSVEKVQEFYDLIPATNKELMVMPHTTHAKIPTESWEAVATWVDRVLTQ